MSNVTFTAVSQSSNDLVKGACSIKIADALVADARTEARNARIQWHVNVFASLKARKVTALGLGKDLDAARESGDLSEDIKAITNKDLSYVKTIGEMLLLPSTNDVDSQIPANVAIGKLWLLVKQGMGVKAAEAVIRAKGQTVGGAYSLIKAAADKANEDKRTTAQTPAGLLKASFGPYGKALKMIADGAEITDEVRALLAAFVAGAANVAKLDSERKAAATPATGEATVTVIQGEIAA